MTTLWEENLDFVDSAEVHWSTSTIMTVFFAASLISALFFGLGFSFGRGGTAKSSSDIGSSAAIGPSEKTAYRAATDVPSPRNFNEDAELQQAQTSVASMQSAVQHISVSKDQKTLALPGNTSKPNIAAAHLTAAGRGITTQSVASRYMVQVGAIGDRKDALRLVARLRRQGFHAAIYPGKRDKFLHVQLGPFSSAQQAQTERHQVIAHGYHALLKPLS